MVINYGEVDKIYELVNSLKDRLEIEEMYGYYREKLKDYKLDKESLQKLIDRFEGDEKLKFQCGIAMSALINNSPCNDIELELTRPWNYLAMCNTKNVDIIGDVDSWVGAYSKGGTLNIRGNAKYYLGTYMENGEITIYGYVDRESTGYAMKGGKITVMNDIPCCGIMMSGGKIIVKGNANSEVGLGMKGGCIVIEGNGGNFLGKNMRGGNIIAKRAGYGIGDGMTGGNIFIEELDPEQIYMDRFFYHIVVDREGLPKHIYDEIRVRSCIDLMCKISKNAKGNIFLGKPGNAKLIYEKGKLKL